MRWSETCEPAVAVPTVQGFGIKVITSSIEAQFGGKERFNWRGDGMGCTRLGTPRGNQASPRDHGPR